MPEIHPAPSPHISQTPRAFAASIASSRRTAATSGDRIVFSQERLTSDVDRVHAVEALMSRVLYGAHSKGRALPDRFSDFDFIRLRPFEPASRRLADVWWRVIAQRRPPPHDPEADAQSAPRMKRDADSRV